MTEHPARTVVADDKPSYPHLDPNGCCDCDCAVCTRREIDWRQCICPDCDRATCGMHADPAVSS